MQSDNCKDNMSAEPLKAITRHDIECISNCCEINSDTSRRRYVQ